MHKTHTTYYKRGNAKRIFSQDSSRLLNVTDDGPVQFFAIQVAKHHKSHFAMRWISLVKELIGIQSVFNKNKTQKSF